MPLLKRLRLKDSAGAVHTSLFPQEIFTGTGTDPRPRLRVDEAQTSFWEGREFRTFREWDSATTAAVVIRAVVPSNVILHELGFQIDEGTVRVETVVGGTPGGAWAEVLPRFSTNNMDVRPTPFYLPTVTLDSGGTHSGGTTLDILRAKTSGNSNFASSVGAGTGGPRGVGAGTYYFRITLTGAIGLFKARWEEVQPGSPNIINY